MTKKLLSLFIAVITAVGIQAQEWTQRQEPPSIHSVNYAVRLVAEIVEAAGMQANFQVAEADVPNAMAVVHQGRRYILYNPGFIEQLNLATGTRWAAVSVLAHEIGHHLYPTAPGRLLATELESDQFSGYVLKIMGATLQEAQAAMKVLGTPEATETHPAARDRLSSIALGWSRAGRTMQASRNETAVAERKPAPRVQPRENYPTVSRREQLLPDAQIAAVLKFDTDTRNEYFLTQEMKVVKFDGQRLEVIAWLTRSDSYEYPYILYDESGYRLYVHRQGQIVTWEGKGLGRLQVV